MLKISSLDVAYGGLRALSGISLEAPSGQFVAVVGPNGAGKTTLFKSISGTVEPRDGSVTFDGVNLSTLPAHERPHLGIAHVPEGRKVFAGMTVYENLEMGATTTAGRKRWNDTLNLLFEIFPRLKDRRDQYAGTLSGGEQQMLAIGRGLASAPKLLMLDEPSMGLSPSMTDTIFDAVARIHREQGLTILLVEQRVAEALENCDYAYVLETGRVVLEGSLEELSSDDRIRRAYLGL
jgi:branched-chain amino acid transport system ATP-binding protein